MRLSDFVREALRDIALGVHAAKSDARDLVAIVPGSLNGQSLLEKSYVEFDIAVAAEAATESKLGSAGKAGAGISVIGLKLGADGAISEDTLRKASSSLTSRIAFKVPVYFNAHFRGDAGSSTEADFVAAKWAEAAAAADSRG